MTEVTAEEIDVALRGFLPLMSCKEATVGNLLEKLAEAFEVDTKELKAEWRKFVKQKAMELVVLCHDYKEVMEEAGASEPEDREQGKSDEEEQELPRARSNGVRSKSPTKRSRIMISDESEEDESEEEAGSEADQGASDSDEAPAKRRKTTKVKEVKKSRTKAPSAKKSPTPAKPRTPKMPKSTDPPGLAALKELGRAAGVLNPRVYMALKGASSTEEAEDILRERLQETGIRFTGSYPSTRDITTAKKKRARDKELEDIDTSLIITDSRPRRSSAHAVSYAPPPAAEAGEDLVGGFGKEEDDEDDEDEAQDEPDESEASGSESEEGSEAEF